MVAASGDRVATHGPNDCPWDSWGSSRHHLAISWRGLLGGTRHTTRTRPFQTQNQYLVEHMVPRDQQSSPPAPLFIYVWGLYVCLLLWVIAFDVCAQCMQAYGCLMGAS